MIISLYAIKDDADKGYGAPFFAPGDKSAKRVFEQAILSNEIKRRHCEDYELYSLADMNTDNGNVIGHDPELIDEGKNYGE